MVERARKKWKEKLSLILCKIRFWNWYLLDFWPLPSAYWPQGGTSNLKGTITKPSLIPKVCSDRFNDIKKVIFTDIFGHFYEYI
jgi:hypothetical protein